MNYFGNQPATKNQNNSSILVESLLKASQHEQPSKASDLYGAARIRFIQKVYTILSIQLLVTVFMSALSMGSLSFFKFQVENIALFYLFMIGAVVTQIWIFCCNGGKTYPLNMILTGIFTICQAYIVSFLCSMTGMQSGNIVVFEAAFMTLAVVVACSLYALYTKQDYTTSSAIIVVLGVVLFCLFIVCMFTSSPFIQALYCAVGVLLFGIYIIIDTQMIIGGRTIQLEIDDYFTASMLLYVDIISIFIYILQLLGLANSNSGQ